MSSKYVLRKLTLQQEEIYKAAMEDPESIAIKLVKVKEQLKEFFHQYDTSNLGYGMDDAEGFLRKFSREEIRG